MVLSLVAWGGQLVAVVAPKRAGDLGLADVESDVDRVFWLDGRGEALWDVAILWTMPVAGGLLIAGHGWWPYFGLIGGGSYLYFAGRGIAVRRLLRRNAVRIGSEANVRVGLAALAIWGVMALVTIVAAVVALEAS